MFKKFFSETHIQKHFFTALPLPEHELHNRNPPQTSCHRGSCSHGKNVVSAILSEMSEVDVEFKSPMPLQNQVRSSVLAKLHRSFLYTIFLSVSQKLL
jgi:hypothetical protein